MTIPKKESELARRLKMWFSVVGASGVTVVAVMAFSLKQVESKVVQPYVDRRVCTVYDSLHRPAEDVLGAIRYNLELQNNLWELTASDSVMKLAKEMTDNKKRYWRPIGNGRSKF